MNLAQFNKTYKNSLKEIKLQEKVNPRKAKNMWLNLIKLMVSFGKSDECPANLRHSIAEKAENLLNKVKRFEKGEINSVFTAERTQKQSSSSPSISSKKESKISR